MGPVGTLFWSGPRNLSGAAPVDAIERVLGARAWMSLRPAVRARFSRHEPVAYDGETLTHLTFLGRAFAWALLMFGAPLPLFGGRARAQVVVRPVLGGMSWSRHYRGPLGLKFSVRSVKRLAEDGRLLECCAGGWTMLLDLKVEAGILIFRSRQFFWRFGGLSIPLPVWMTPGIAEVQHTDLGDGFFRFTLTFDHPWFGRTVDQDGIFQDPEV